MTEKCKTHSGKLVPGPGGRRICIECWAENGRRGGCPKTTAGVHRWVTYVERNPYRRGMECRLCGYRMGSSARPRIPGVFLPHVLEPNEHDFQPFDDEKFDLRCSRCGLKIVEEYRGMAHGMQPCDVERGLR